MRGTLSGASQAGPLSFTGVCLRKGLPQRMEVSATSLCPILYVDQPMPSTRRAVSMLRREAENYNGRGMVRGDNPKKG
ncbi:hypothetical protein DPMN_167074 [Dreissena polymorpha]|uniref:Uncharacterized protein n=1 Tax=Dreissena polymorpha TaxID=45954 RepID=A0A9D4F382_DREPO|nr:hypothetical protein DPMN_167074 [Dreissena polymorpha]